MEKRYKLALDVDGTLLNSAKLVRLLKAELVLTTGKKADQIETLFEEYKKALEDSTQFNHADFISFAVAQGYARAQVENAFNNQEIFAHCMFADVRSFLEEVQAFCSLWIFSQAVEEWQQHKLELSGIAALVDEWNAWIIRQNKMTLEVIAELPQGAILFDDKLEVLEAVSAARDDVRCVWVNRLSTQADVPFIQIHDFAEVDKEFLEQLQNERAQLQIEL